MADVLIFGGGVAAGYVLSIFTWPGLRTFFGGAEQELAWLKERAAAIEARLRASFGQDQS